MLPSSTIVSIEARALSVPLRDPFVIASARIETTQSVLVTVTLSSGETGIGEAAALPPVTREDQAAVLLALRAAEGPLVGLALSIEDGARAALDEALGHSPVARAGVEMAILDALCKRDGIPLRVALGAVTGMNTTTLVTDITIPILPEARMVTLAREWRGRGFTCFKVKIGKDEDADFRALSAIHGAIPDATFRVDANAAFSAAQAIRLARAIEGRGLAVECYEQPCAAQDLDAMAEVAAALTTPVIADESVANDGDLARVIAKRAADGINLKLMKSGGPLAAYALGKRAREAGLELMTGGMVETRLGMTAAAHVVAALGGVQYVDLDTAWLLTEDPFEGGYEADGPRYTLLDRAGLGIALRR